MLGNARARASRLPEAVDSEPRSSFWPARSCCVTVRSTSADVGVGIRRLGGALLREVTVVCVLALTVLGCGDAGSKKTSGGGQAAAPSAARQPSGQALAVQQLEQCVRRWNSGPTNADVSGFLSSLGDDPLVRVSLSDREEIGPAAFLEAGNCIISAESTDGRSAFTLAENRDTDLDGVPEPGFGHLGPGPYGKYLPSDTEPNARLVRGEQLELLISSGL